MAIQNIDSDVELIDIKNYPIPAEGIVYNILYTNEKVWSDYEDYMVSYLSYSNDFINKEEFIKLSFSLVEKISKVDKEVQKLYRYFIITGDGFVNMPMEKKILSSFNITGMEDIIKLAKLQCRAENIINKDMMWFMGDTDSSRVYTEDDFDVINLKVKEAFEKDKELRAGRVGDTNVSNNMNSLKELNMNGNNTNTNNTVNNVENGAPQNEVVGTHSEMRVTSSVPADEYSEVDWAYWGKIGLGVAAVAGISYLVYDAVTSEKVTIIDTNSSGANYNWA